MAGFLGPSFFLAFCVDGADFGGEWWNVERYRGGISQEKIRRENRDGSCGRWNEECPIVEGGQRDDKGNERSETMPFKSAFHGNSGKDNSATMRRVVGFAATVRGRVIQTRTDLSIR